MSAPPTSRLALRELQMRLAQRLAAVRQAPLETQWLAVECAGVGLLLPLAQAGEIFPGADLVSVPHTRPWVLGVANLRGQVVVAIDLAVFLGLRERATAPARAPAWAAEAEAGAAQQDADDVDLRRLVVLSPALGVNAALRVDRIVGLRQPKGWSRRAPIEGPHPAYAAQSWCDGQGRPWQVLELSALASDDRFRSVGG